MEKLKAVGYTRYSSSLQNEMSTVAQKRFISAYCAHNNIELVRFYVDEERTGKNINREGFQSLLNDIRNGADFSAVICHKLDRFSRNVADTSKYIDEFASHNIELISVSENLNNTPSGVMFRNVLASFNEYYVRNLALEVKKGLREVALKCEWTGGTPPLGYDVVDKKLVINPDEAKAVSLIFEMFSQGCGYQKICKQLNLLGFKTKKGVKFGKSSIYGILHNEKYKGEFVYNKTSPRKFNCTRNSHRKNDENDIIRIKGGCPAIVDEELWNKCNKVFTTTKQYGKNAKNNYLLTGLVYCAECGCKFHGNHRNQRNDKNSYLTYRCSNKDVKCHSKEIRAEKLEKWVLNEIFESLLFNKDIVHQIHNEINKKVNLALENNNSYLQNKKQLCNLKDVQNNLIEALIQIGTNEALSAKIKENELKISKLQNLIKEQEIITQKNSISVSKVEYEIDKIRKAFVNPKCFEQLKLLISQIVDTIEVGNDKITMTYKIDIKDCDTSYTSESYIDRGTLISRNPNKNKIIGNAYEDILNIDFGA